MEQTTFKTNKIRGPINSWVFRNLDNYMNFLFKKEKKKLFKNHPNTVVEIGSGTGANMKYLRTGTKLIAIEPNVYMHNNLKKSAEKYGINLEIRTLTGESIDLPDNSSDFVISTLVLCTVDNPVECINQIKRILKHSGEFAFIEHVKAREGSVLSYIQNICHKPWHWFFEGCNTNRNINELLESGGFKVVKMEAYNLYTPFIPITSQIRGKAIK